MTMSDYLRGSTVYVALTEDKNVSDAELFADKNDALTAAATHLADELENRAPGSDHDIEAAKNTAASPQELLDRLHDLAGNVYGIDSWASVEKQEIN